MDVSHWNITVDSRCREDVNLLKPLLEVDKPSWRVEDVKIKRMLQDLSRAGFVNVNLVCRHGDEAIFVRINNPVMRCVYNDQLVLARRFVNKHGLSAKLLSTFENGFVEECLEGEAVTMATRDRLKDEEVKSAIIKEMVRYHRNDVMEDAIGCGIQTDLPLFRRDWLDEMWKQIEDGGLVEKSTLDSLPGRAEIVRERQELVSLMDRLRSRRAFCHYDIHASNIYILPHGRVVFTDYETCCLSYVAAEIGYFFFLLNFEMGVQPFTVYPEVDLRRKFCRQYLVETSNLEGVNAEEITAEQENILETQVAVGKLMAALAFVAYMYGFLSRSIFNTPLELETVLRNIRALWENYYAEKSCLLKSLNL